jgi:hypothetical protein
VAIGLQRCEVLDITLNRDRGQIKSDGDDFKGASGRLVMVVDPKGWTHFFSCPYYGPWPASKVNDYLKNALKSKVRVNKHGVPYLIEEPPEAEVEG